MRNEAAFGWLLRCHKISLCPFSAVKSVGIYLKIEGHISRCTYARHIRAENGGEPKCSYSVFRRGPQSVASVSCF